MTIFAKSIPTSRFIRFNHRSPAKWANGKQTSATPSTSARSLGPLSPATLFKPDLWRPRKLSGQNLTAKLQDRHRSTPATTDKSNLPFRPRLQENFRG